MPVLKVKHNGEWINVGSSGSGGGSNINIDSTLTQSGSAADAKASGDAIRNLNTLVGNKSVAEQIQEAIGSGGNTGGSGITVQSDWNQNDSSQLNFIKNKPFYDEGQPCEISIFNQENMNFIEVPNMDESGTMNVYIPESYEEEMALRSLQFIAGNTYTVIIDGTSYSTQAKGFGGLDMTYIGNLNLAVSVYPSTGENFLVIPSDEMLIVNDSNNSHNITIKETKLAIQKEIVSQNTYSFPQERDITYLNLTDFDFSSLKEGDLLIVNYNGKEYSCNVADLNGMGIIFGNGAMLGFYDVQNNEPFTGMYVEGMSGMYAYPTKISFRIEKIISDTETEIIVPEDTPYTVYIEDGIYYDFSNPTFVIEPETSYKVFWNNVEYICVSSSVSNGKIILEPDLDSDIFLFEYSNNEDELYAGFVVYSGGPEVLNEQIQINGLVSGVKKIDKKYIPNNIDIPVASYDKIGGVKVYNTTSDNLSSASGYSKIWLSTNDNTIYAKAPTMSNLTFTGNTNTTYNGSSPITVNIPTALKNPNRLTFTGGSTATYDGSSAVSVAIPTSLKNPNALTFNGYTSATYDGSSAKTITLPTSLKNPYALTFTGGATNTYDGSSAKTIDIPVVPTSLKNPYALTFTGLIEGSYDGSEAVNIEIPTGLPEVTNDNNDQILQVVDGAWKANNPVFNYTAYIDQGNGYKYYVYMYNGELVIQVECTGIEVTTMPTTMEYYYGEAFNPAGMVVNAISADGSTKIITDYTYSAPEFITENTAITISWVQYDQTYSTTFEVSVIECTEIEVTTLPTKTEYFSGQTFDPTGMTVTATYADGYTKVITDYTCSANLTVDNPTVTISYANSISTFEVTVHDSNAEFIDFTYTINEDNSIILDTWKGTLNGVNSTECVIPDGNGVAKIII